LCSVIPLHCKNATTLYPQKFAINGVAPNQNWKLAGHQISGKALNS